MVGKFRSAWLQIGALLLVLLMLAAAWPASADAHGATDPVASSYLARIRSVPRGLRATVVDGDLRLWLQVPRGASVLVRDYRGAPYLRFARGLIWVNTNSQMFYFNQTPPVDPPSGLNSSRPPHWVQVGSGDSYEWHDGRLHASALEAVAPGSSYAGSWRIPLMVNGRVTAVSGTLWRRGAPSIVWFWPIAVLVLSVVALWRLRDVRLDVAVARALATLTLAGVALAAVGRDLHGRPGLSGFGVGEMAVILVLAGWMALRVARNRAGSFSFFLIAAAGMWDGLSLISTLLHGYVLLAVPPLLGRLATVVCLGGALALPLPAVRLFRREVEHEAEELPAADVVEASV